MAGVRADALLPTSASARLVLSHSYADLQQQLTSTTILSINNSARSYTLAGLLIFYYNSKGATPVGPKVIGFAARSPPSYTKRIFQRRYFTPNYPT